MTINLWDILRFALNKFIQIALQQETRFGIRIYLNWLVELLNLLVEFGLYAMVKVSLGQFFIDSWMLAAERINNIVLHLQYRKIEFAGEIESIIEGQSIIALDHIAIDFFVIDVGIFLDFFEEIGGLEDDLSEEEGVALLRVLDKAGDELLHLHLPQREIVQPQIIILLYPHMQDLLHVRSHLGLGDVLLFHLNQIDPVEIFMQLEFSYLLPVMHLHVVEDQDLVVLVYISLALDLLLKVTHELLFV